MRKTALYGAASLIGMLGVNVAQACGVALVLAVDVSGSVDTREYNIQMQGLSRALADPSVSEALVRSKASVALLQWTGTSRQSVSIPFRSIDSIGAAREFAEEVGAAPRVWRNFSTAVGEALRAAADLMASAPTCDRRIIDISSDGVSNEGPAPQALHPRLGREKITVNALVIEGAEDNLTVWYQRNVIFGPGAFVATANGYDAYPVRIRQKLLRELVLQLSSASFNDLGKVHARK